MPGRGKRVVAEPGRVKPVLGMFECWYRSGCRWWGSRGGRKGLGTGALGRGWTGLEKEGLGGPGG